MAFAKEAAAAPAFARAAVAWLPDENVAPPRRMSPAWEKSGKQKRRRKNRKPETGNRKVENQRDSAW